MPISLSKASEVLKRARECVKKGWTQGVIARNEAGDGVRPADPSAVCWCASGAITRAVYDMTGEEPKWFNESGALLCMARDVFIGALAGAAVCIPDWNDIRGMKQEEVVRKFDKAINMLEQEEGQG